MKGLVDVHIHFSGRQDDALVPFARRNKLAYTMKELRRSMTDNGIVAGLLLSPPLTTGAILPNEDVISLCNESRGLFSPVITVTPTVRGVREALSISRKHKSAVKGFKVLLGYFKVFCNDPTFDPLFDLAEKEGLPVMFHTGDTASSSGSLKHSHPLTLDSLANSRPGLKVVACHFGNPWIADVGELMYKHEKVYADLSGLAVGGGRYYREYTDWIARKISEAIYFSAGAEKVLFGSDYPVTSQRAALELVDKLEIHPEDKRKILTKNSAQVFKI